MSKEEPYVFASEADLINVVGFSHPAKAPEHTTGQKSSCPFLAQAFTSTAGWPRSPRKGAGW
ncbi:MAG: hypothetical protein AAF399_20570 [Bacteroidota bacterium]